MTLTWKHLQRRTLLKLTNTKNKKQQQLNSTSSTEHKTDMSITKINKYNKTEQYLYDGIQYRHELELIVELFTV